MAPCLFRLMLPDDTVGWARGGSADRAEELLPADFSLDAVLSGRSHDVGAAVLDPPGAGRPPEGSTAIAPIESQEVWAAGVTYLRSRQARESESGEDGSAYDRVYRAARPELFHKAAGWRVRGPGEPIGVRADSGWNVPEPELVLCLSADMSVVGLTIGNDVSSRSIEGENTLYLPQAKTYDGSCAMGPCLVIAESPADGIGIRLTVVRGGVAVIDGQASTAQLKRSFGELVSYLGRALSFPVGAFLFTGTGIVPPDDFTLEPGDLTRIEIDGLGTLENPVVRVGTHTPSAKS
ncbi:MAG: fumarylacetoacetate hydrolase family protein [Acidimicrobiales bacterium]